jgi:ataxin-7
MFQTHALGLRRAVPGRKKSFDDLLKEHKAAKEAMLKAKAEEQAAAGGGVGVSLASHSMPQPTLVSSPAALAAVSAIKPGNSDLSVSRDIKPTLLSQPSFQRSLKPAPPRPQVNAVFQK